MGDLGTFVRLFYILNLLGFYFNKYIIFSFISKNGPSPRRRTTTCWRQLVWRVHIRVDVYVNLTWQHLGADLHVYKYTTLAVGFLIFG
jgi:hypothetical protein